jgi:putative endonuclease
MLANLWRKQRGDVGEERALQLLQQYGLQLVTRNFRCKLGEIDLIMTEREHLVFVEVRVRKNALFGSASDSITLRKQQRIIRAAQFFLQTHPQWQQAPCRFDAVTITGHQAPEWCRDAFQLS